MYNLDETQDYQDAWQQLRDRTSSDIVWSTANGGHWIPLRGRDIHAIFSDHERFSSRLLFVPQERAAVYHGLPNTLDPPDHQPFRALLTPIFSASHIRAIEPEIRSRAAMLIDNFKELGQCDFVAGFATKLPIGVFMMLCDLPMVDAPMLKRWSDQLPRPDGSMTLDAMLEKFNAYLLPFLEHRQKHPGNDLLSRLTCGEVHGRRVSLDEAMNLCSQALFGGLDTVAALLSFAMKFLASSPLHRQRLAADRTLIPAAVNEIVRRYAIAVPGRVVRKDCDFAGFQFKEGDMIVLPTMLHGLDDREFERPLEVDFTRDVGPVSTFGNGHHVCPGQFLGRAELRITLEEWIDRIPEFWLEPDAIIEMTGGMVGVMDHLPLRWSSSGGTAKGAMTSAAAIAR
jgi:cytochrome P450